MISANFWMLGTIGLLWLFKPLFPSFNCKGERGDADGAGEGLFSEYLLGMLRVDDSYLHDNVLCGGPFYNVLFKC